MLHHTSKYFLACLHWLGKASNFGKWLTELRSNSKDYAKKEALYLSNLGSYFWHLCAPSGNFYFLATLSTVFITWGSIDNNILAILAGGIFTSMSYPIEVMAYAIAMGQPELLRRSSSTLIKGGLLTVIVALLMVETIGLTETKMEIATYTELSEMNLGVAILAGALVNHRHHIRNILSKIAIAIAVITPSSVLGISLAQYEGESAITALFVLLISLIIVVFVRTVDFLRHSDRSIF